MLNQSAALTSRTLQRQQGGIKDDHEKIRVSHGLLKIVYY
jgi:hypothetical protein